MSRLTEEQKAKGRKRFLDANSDARRKVEALTQADADFMCTTLEELRKMETMKALGDYARLHRKDSTELFFSCVADTAEEFQQLVDANNLAIQKAIGLA